eukprot:6637725-Pyramimonas_sp.AAC.1
MEEEGGGMEGGRRRMRQSAAPLCSKSASPLSELEFEVRLSAQPPIQWLRRYAGALGQRGKRRSVERRS